MSDQAKRAAGYAPTTAEIIYRQPDDPRILNTYVWRGLDLPPGYPELTRFLRFWRSELNGPVQSVRISTPRPTPPVTIRVVTQPRVLH